MQLRLSRFVHLLPMGPNRILVVDAISQVRLVVNTAVARRIAEFVPFKEVGEPDAGEELIAGLLKRGILTEKTPEQEARHVVNLLSPYHGRDPENFLDGFRRAAREGVEPYWAATSVLKPDDFSAKKYAAELLLFGDCDVQMESDFLRQEAARRGITLKIAASFPDDMRLAGEHTHDAILIGALRQRFVISQSEEAAPYAAYIAEARKIIEELRRHSSAPILIDNIPEPTVTPLGLAERGARGHRNRYRAANIALSELVEPYADVHVVDIAAVLNAAGAERLLDDGQNSFSHLGSPGWLLQRPENEKRAVHNMFPDITALAQTFGGDPYLRERVTAPAHMDALTTVLGIDRKKCVIVDLDGVLWPGVLAETGQPFAWNTDISGPFSYVGHYFGLHDALLQLKRRGILLACVSKNDEVTVRELWKFGPQYDAVPTLKPDDFVTSRINWNDKVENIRSIADELGFAPETFLFIDDHPVERDRVRQRLPDVEVWGDDLFALRRKLLCDPRLQLPRLTAESIRRTELARAQLDRQAARTESVSEAKFIASLGVEVLVARPDSGEDLIRVAELFQRTSQFNTTGIKCSAGELETLLLDVSARVFICRVKDRFGDHGLAGAAVVKDGEITGLVLSCRVLGMGVEHDFLAQIIQALSLDHDYLYGRIVETARNLPVRNIYRDNGFAKEDNIWRRRLK